MFSEEMQDLLGIRSEIDSGDLDASDRFFDSIKENTVYTPRCRAAWAPCLDWSSQVFPSYSLFPANHHHLTSASSQPYLHPASPLSDIEENDVCQDSLTIEEEDIPASLWESVSLKGLGTVKITGLSTINTSFDPNLQVNRVYSGPRQNPEANFEFTSQHHIWAKDAYEPKNLQDLCNKLVSQLRKGYKLSPDKYIKIPLWLFQKWMIRINDIHGEFLALFASMPDHLKANLLDLLTLLFLDIIKDIDMAILGIFHVYETLHWDWYNHYSTRGEGVPTGIHPDLLTKDGAKKSSSSQFFPRQSQEARDHPEHIQKLQKLFKEVFQWQQSVVC
ncbi:hypothetical protein BDZ94DRAFT_1309503 [Collybia nuda]|uniref:Uncharacterized protein n=1 Tax=Collybia nuda TaxID=64659 RepID=A0A9P6CE55_9AGAR|nr:hypothetical protein BDZ94DRAFT_1309503 [Collybia nuda]